MPTRRNRQRHRTEGLPPQPLRSSSNLSGGDPGEGDPAAAVEGGVEVGVAVQAQCRVAGTGRPASPSAMSTARPTSLDVRVYDVERPSGGGVPVDRGQEHLLVRA